MFSIDVRGDSGKIYHTMIYLKCGKNTDEINIGEYSCTCQAFQNYSGICKHLVAAMLEINERMNMDDVYEILQRKRTSEKTSQVLKDVISDIVLKERNEFCQEIAAGDVKLEVTLYLHPDLEKHCR